MKIVSYLFALMALVCLVASLVGAPHQIVCAGIFVILHLMTRPEEEEEKG